MHYPPLMTLTMLAPCWSCKHTFMSDPDKVVSVSVCRECSHPADMHPEACTRTGEVVREPLCLSCAYMVNDARRGRGENPIRIDRGAYV
jgi:hypothetical protein